MGTLQNSFDDNTPPPDATGTVPCRIDAHYIKEEMAHLLHLEKGFLYTVKELAIRPGKTIRTFLFESRKRYTKPVIFLIVTSLIYTVIISYLGIVGEAGEGETYFSFLNWMEKNQGYANIIMGFFVSVWIAMFFRKYRFNFFEISVLACYVMGQCMLILSLYVLLEPVVPSAGGIIRLMLGITLLVYTSWAIGQSFEKKVINYCKGGFAVFLGVMSFYLVAIVVSMLYDWVLRGN